nr:hypothetical protein [uncultured Noviherbaspirillum sp.]
MSSIDRISIDRPGQDNFLAEERRRQLARQHQMQLRETSRLVLPSVEMQSRLSGKRALDGRRQEKELASANSAAAEEMENADSRELDLLGLALDVSRSASAKAMEDNAELLDPRSSLEPLAQDRRNEVAGPDIDRKNAGNPALPTTIASQKHARLPAAFQHMQEAEMESAGISAEPVQTGKLGALSWAQKLKNAFAQSRSDGSLAAMDALEDLFDRIMHEVQTNAIQSETLTPELEAALETLFEQRKGASGTSAGSAETSRLEGSYRFMDAFLMTMGDSSHGHLGSAKNFLPEKSGLADAMPEMAGIPAENDKVTGPHSANGREKISPARDRQTLYEFLELLSRAAASSTPVALQQLAQARLANPEKALLRLAATGDPAVALYTPEISRRFDLISARIERDERKTARVNLLADVVQTQKKWMNSVIAEADSIVGYRALARRSDAEQREKNVAETLPLLILNKT